MERGAMKRRLAAWIDSVGNGLLRLGSLCFEAAYTLDPARMEEEDRLARETARADVAPWLSEAVERIYEKSYIPPPESIEVTAARVVEATNKPVFLFPTSAIRQHLN
jgi:hypothetical protein